MREKKAKAELQSSSKIHYFSNSNHRSLSTSFSKQTKLSYVLIPILQFHITAFWIVPVAFCSATGIFIDDQQQEVVPFLLYRQGNYTVQKDLRLRWTLAKMKTTANLPLQLEVPKPGNVKQYLTSTFPLHS